MTVTQPDLFTDHYYPDLVEPVYEPEATLGERYEAWIGANPHVLTVLAGLALDEVDHGATRLSIGHLVEVARWHHLMATSRDGGFAINNSFRSRLARDLMTRNRALDGLFETRQLHTT